MPSGLPLGHPCSISICPLLYCDRWTKRMLLVLVGGVDAVINGNPNRGTTFVAMVECFHWVSVSISVRYLFIRFARIRILSFYQLRLFFPPFIKKGVCVSVWVWVRERHTCLFKLKLGVSPNDYSGTCFWLNLLVIVLFILALFLLVLPKHTHAPHQHLCSPWFLACKWEPIVPSFCFSLKSLSLGKRTKSAGANSFFLHCTQAMKKQAYSSEFVLQKYLLPSSDPQRFLAFISC